ncbi:Vesicle transport protein S20 [Coemansia spiralis]|uniref:Vesicle transport protein S20 n=2 Tax=Coemansia TaxID=4863 RepID=A0A9W8FZY6_9FUNG|nr:Sec20-domain-containing protein [Coemansia spiralis]KAJ1989782.1 Vesicle transport protein S20 [Coemansia umbellata]KAJ2621388.1 Vesicle transport protein S20 [Coemansia sp. RSA 1358]KAJ2673449.1 Vesicle transport protein S20 [Coemansia spiralis]
MDSADIEAQLRTLSRDLDHAENDIAALGKFSGPRDEHRELSDAIRNQLRAVDRALARLELDTDTTELKARSLSVQRGFRQALLKYKENIAKTTKMERELLLSGAATPAELRRRKAQGNSALNVAADVTTALQETVSMMDQEIDKSVGNIMALEDSTDALRRTRSQYITLDDVLRTSGNLVRALERADAVDRWLMLAGLVLFALVSFNILRKRVWIPGLDTLLRAVGYIVWLPVRSAMAGVSTEAVVAAPTTTTGLSLATASIATITAFLPKGTLTVLQLSVDGPMPTAPSDSLLSLGASEMDDPETTDELDAENKTPAEQNSPIQLPPPNTHRHYKPPVERIREEL